MFAPEQVQQRGATRQTDFAAAVCVYPAYAAELSVVSNPVICTVIGFLSNNIKAVKLHEAGDAEKWSK